MNVIEMGHYPLDRFTENSHKDLMLLMTPRADRMVPTMEAVPQRGRVSAVGALVCL